MITARTSHDAWSQWTQLRDTFAARIKRAARSRRNHLYDRITTISTGFSNKSGLDRGLISSAKLGRHSSAPPHDH